jgi:signal transduction histidine kinase
MEHLPAAFALTRGREHSLIYANAAFRKLLTLDGQLAFGGPIQDVFDARDREEMGALLDRAFRSGVVSRNRAIEPGQEGVLTPRCTVWPDIGVNGGTDHLLLELRPATQDELRLGLHRRVAERLMLSALREHDAAAISGAARRGAEFLEGEGRRLAESLDESKTLDALRRMSLPPFGDWCFVDLAADDGSMRRLPISHPDSSKQAILGRLDDRWIPKLDDEFGLPAVRRRGGDMAIVDDAETVLSTGSPDRRIGDALRSVGASAFLTMPLILQDRLVGAVTFVGDHNGHVITTTEIALAGELTSRGAMALDRARLHGEAIASKSRAESANEAKGAFLGMMSHELRTPLNAIAGYVDLIDLELRGPVTAAQHVDLERIRANQKYLTALINDLLNLTKIVSGHVAYDLADLNTRDVLASGVAMLEPLLAQKELTFDGIFCDASIVTHADREKVTQILINLLSNSIKFTEPGGHLRIDATETASAVVIKVSDTGIGIEANKLADIFEPFVQISDRLTGMDGGIGLGLAISRDLARAMGGDLAAESALGKGSSFTLTLPRSSSRPRSMADSAETREEGTPRDSMEEGGESAIQPPV